MASTYSPLYVGLLQPDFIGPLCHELGIAKPLVQMFCQDGDFASAARRHLPLEMCTKGLVIELWEHLSFNMGTTLTKKEKVVILGRILYNIFGDETRQVLDIDHLMININTLMRKRRTCPRYTRKTQPKKKKRLSLPELKKEIFNFCEGEVAVSQDLEEGGITEEGEVEGNETARHGEELRKLKFENTLLKKKIQQYIEKEKREGGPFSEDEERKFALEIAIETKKNNKKLRLELEKRKEKCRSHRNKIKILTQASCRRKALMVKRGKIIKKLQQDVQALKAQVYEKSCSKVQETAAENCQKNENLAKLKDQSATHSQISVT